jgi:hypothetical protein
MNKQELIEKYEYMSHACFRRVDTLEVLKDLRQLDEPQKVTIPQFVADLLEFAKLNDWDLEDVFEDVRNEHSDTEISEWFYQKKNMDILARAWLDGYTIKKDKRYRVEMKGISSLFRHLKYSLLTEKWYMGNDTENEDVKKTHTRKEIEDAGFGEVFNSTLFEVEEVE